MGGFGAIDVGCELVVDRAGLTESHVARTVHDQASRSARRITRASGQKATNSTTRRRRGTG